VANSKSIWNYKRNRLAYIKTINFTCSVGHINIWFEVKKQEIDKDV